MIPVAHTSLGLKISTGVVPYEKGNIVHYTLSAASLNNETDKKLIVNHQLSNKIGQLIQILRHQDQSFRIQEGQSGIYHIIFEKKY